MPQQKKISTKMVFLICLTVVSSIISFAQCSSAFDEQNCLLCHKYRGLSYVDEKGKLTLLHITDLTYLNSPHAILKCGDCHVGIEGLPHKNVKKVDCTVICHVKEPLTEKLFSHKKVLDFLNESVHAKRDEEGKLKEHQEDLPNCKKCHNDPLYRPFYYFKTAHAGISKRATGRCLVCHEDETYVKRFYSHLSSRMQKLRPPKELVEMCSKCHEDNKMMQRHNLINAAHYYKETYHGKAIYFGDEWAPDCLDCHVKPGESVHLMYAEDDPRSSVYKDERSNTCAALDCHPGSNPKLAGYDPHASPQFKRNPVIFCATLFFFLLTTITIPICLLMCILDAARRLFPHYSLLSSKKEK